MCMPIIPLSPCPYLFNHENRPSTWVSLQLLGSKAQGRHADLYSCAMAEPIKLRVRSASLNLLSNSEGDDEGKKGDTYDIGMLLLGYAFLIASSMIFKLVTIPSGILSRV